MACRKLSFLIPAHNEGKIIGRTLDALSRLPYSSYEVLIGLDGCTDNTEKIVREYADQSDTIRYYALSLRKGKPAVIDALMKHATGDIVIINDADWVFRVNNKDSLEQFLSVFDDATVGGIAEAYPVEWDEALLGTGNWVFRMIAVTSYEWFEFQKRKFTVNEGNKLFVTTPMMFLTNIFRRELYRPNSTLGDDFERTYELHHLGKRIVLFPDMEMPRMISTYNTVRLRDLFRQKIRTARARTQLHTLEHPVPPSYLVASTLFIFLRSWKHGLFHGILASGWIMLNIFATIRAKFKMVDTQKGWLLRVER